MARRPTQYATLDDAFRIFATAAANGERCPKTGEFGLTSTIASTLARRGDIRIDVYPHNWRVVTILVGEHKGKHTLLPANSKWKPYLTIRKDSPPKPSYTARNSP